MGTHRLVLDTNIYISGFGWSGPSDECVELVLGDEAIGYSSQAILDELERVLGYDRLPFTRAQQSAFHNIVTEGTELVAPTVKHDDVTSDPDDNMVIDCAVEAGADYIVTGNTDDFPNSYQGTEIVEPAEYVREIT